MHGASPLAARAIARRRGIFLGPRARLVSPLSPGPHAPNEGRQKKKTTPNKQGRSINNVWDIPLYVCTGDNGECFRINNSSLSSTRKFWAQATTTTATRARRQHECFHVLLVETHVYRHRPPPHSYSGPASAPGLLLAIHEKTTKKP